MLSFLSVRNKYRSALGLVGCETAAQRDDELNKLIQNDNKNRNQHYYRLKTIRLPTTNGFPYPNQLLQ